MPFQVGDSVRLTYPFGTHAQGADGISKHEDKEVALSRSCIHSAGGGKGVYTILEVVDLSIGFPQGKGPSQSKMPPKGFSYLLAERPGYFDEKFVRQAT